MAFVCSRQKDQEKERGSPSRFSKFFFPFDRFEGWHLNMRLMDFHPMDDCTILERVEHIKQASPINITVVGSQFSTGMHIRGENWVNRRVGTGEPTIFWGLSF